MISGADMKTTRGVLIGGSIVFAAAAVVGAQQGKPAAAAPAAAKPAVQTPVAKPASLTAAAPAGYAPVASIKDLMDAVVDPTSKVVFNAVAMESTKEGMKQKAPQNQAEWDAVRRNALM